MIPLIMSYKSDYEISPTQLLTNTKKLKSDELEEHRLDVLVGMEHLVQNDFGNFISVRFAYWGLILAILVIIIGDVPIYDYFNSYFAY